MNRFPAVAGQFYPADPEALTREIRKHVVENSSRTSVRGLVSPHAGFLYSGDTAGAVYSRVEIPDTVIILGPNHTGRGERVSIMTDGVWSMPLGDLVIDTELAESILKTSSQACADSSAHLYEHSIETQLPFLQYFRKKFKIVPICLMRISFEKCSDLSGAIIESINSLQRRVLIIASSDMTHYESHDEASRKDRKAIDRILECDAEGLYQTVEKNNITMCGVIPVTVMLCCASRMGAHRAELIKYMTSGETSGDYDRVVGYAGMIVE